MQQPPANEVLLQELRLIHLSVKDDSHKASVYAAAIRAIEGYPVLFATAEQAKALKGIGDYMVKAIRKIMRNHPNLYPQEAPSAIPQSNHHHHHHHHHNNNSNNNSNVVVAATTAEPKPKRVRREREYKPKVRSGSWALLVGLYSASLDPSYKGFLLKSELIRLATPLCDTPFVPPPPTHTGGGPPVNGIHYHYTAWNTMSSLIKRMLVVQYSNPARHMLTPDGVAVAKGLYAEYYNNNSNNRSSSSKHVVVVGNDNDNDDDKDDNDDEGDDDDDDDVEVEHYCYHSSNNNGSANNDLAAAAEEKPSFDLSQCAEIMLIVDSNEMRSRMKATWKDVEKQLQQQGIKIIDLRLAVGDFLWAAKFHSTPAGVSKFAFKKGDVVVLDFIIERKTPEDLAASIVDGRWEDQRRRLKLTNLDFVFYLIEGDLYAYDPARTSKISRATLEANIASLAVYDNFKILQTSDVIATGFLLVAMTAEVVDHYKRPEHRVTEQGLMLLSDFSKDYTKTAKCETVGQAFVKMLQRFPACSYAKAVAIQAAYPTAMHLYLALKNNFATVDDRVRHLASIAYKVGLTQRLVGVTTAQAIVGEVCSNG